MKLIFHEISEKKKKKLSPGVLMQAFNSSTKEADPGESSFKYKYPRSVQVNFEVQEPCEQTTKIFIPHTMLNI